MWPDIIFGALLCAAGLVFAAHSALPVRLAATRCAIAIGFDFLLYVMAWHPRAPHMLMHISPYEWWSGWETICCLYLAEQAIEYWWGKILVACSILTICSYVLLANGWQFEPISFLIDYTGYVQIIIFIWIGQDGFRNRIASIRNVWRCRLASRQTASR